MNGVTLEISTQDLATPVVRRLITAMEGDGPKKVVGRSARNVYRKWFFGLNSSRPNKMGGQRTNFFTKVGRSVSAPEIQGDTVSIAITQVGIRQRIYGGVITPKKAKLLTIPADPSAYGRRAGEFANLHPIFFKSGAASAGALVTPEGQVMYWLARKVVQRPDPTILPGEDVVLPPLRADLTQYFNRIAGRQTGGAPE